MFIEAKIFRKGFSFVHLYEYNNIYIYIYRISSVYVCVCVCVFLRKTIRKEKGLVCLSRRRHVVYDAGGRKKER